LIFGIATTVSSLNAVIANIIAGIVIKDPTLHNWRKLFILFGIVYLIGGIIYLLLGSAVPEKWATFKSHEQDQNDVQSQEEMLPIQKPQQTDESKAIDNIEDNETVQYIDA